MKERIFEKFLLSGDTTSVIERHSCRAPDKPARFGTKHDEKRV